MMTSANFPGGKPVSRARSASGLQRKMRILHNYLTGYNIGNSRRNGEYRYLKSYLEPGMVVFDVGANVGGYANDVMRLVPGCEIHCFEPVPDTFDELKRHLDGRPLVILNNFGLSFKEGNAQISASTDRSGSGRDSLHPTPRPDGEPLAGLEQINITLSTIDEYVASQGIARIDFLKIDVEGHELSVLRGASRSLSSGVIQAVQFEYGASFISAGSSLGEVYSILTAANFEVFRLLPYGKRRVNSMESIFGLENYQHSNWVAEKMQCKGHG